MIKMKMKMKMKIHLLRRHEYIIYPCSEISSNSVFSPQRWNYILRQGLCDSHEILNFKRIKTNYASECDDKYPLSSHSDVPVPLRYLGESLLTGKTFTLIDTCTASYFSQLEIMNLKLIRYGNKLWTEKSQSKTKG